MSPWNKWCPINRILHTIGDFCLLFFFLQTVVSSSCQHDFSNVSNHRNQQRRTFKKMLWARVNIFAKSADFSRRSVIKHKECLLIFKTFFYAYYFIAIFFFFAYYFTFWKEILKKKKQTTTKYLTIESKGNSLFFLHHPLACSYNSTTGLYL